MSPDDRQTPRKALFDGQPTAEERHQSGRSFTIGDPCTTTCNGFGDCEQQCEEIYWCYETNCAWCYGIGSPEYQNCVGEVHMLKQQCLNNCGKPVGDIS